MHTAVLYYSNTRHMYIHFFFFSSRRRHTRFDCDWSSDVCSSDLKKRAEEFIKKLVSKISKSQMDEFLQNIEMYFEGSSLFMRISKEDLVRRSISLQQNDALKIKISTPVYKKNELVRTYLDLLVK